MSETQNEPLVGDETDPQPVSPETEVDDETADEEEQHERVATEDEREPSEAQSEKDIEAALKRLERAGTTYRNAVSRAMGETAQDLVECPRCNAPALGLIFPPDQVPVSDEQREAVLASVGMGSARQRQLRPAQGVETCPSCGGEGALEYPTFVEHTKEQQCPKCLGSGYVTKNEPQPNVVNFAPLPAANGQSEQSWQTQGLPDAWGRPAGHQHYNVPPASVGA